MSITDRAMKRPITAICAVLSVALLCVLALTRMKIDIFPNLNLPIIYVAQPYGGMSPAQMEGLLVNYYEYHFLYITGIEHVESKSIQSVGLIKLYFHPGTDMSQALAQTVSYVERARAFMPPGTVAPFVVRFDAGSVPVGYLVFSSQSRSLGEIQDLALFRVRPVFATLPGVSSPPPFGGNQRTIVIRVKPDRLRAYHMSPDEVVQALSSGNTIIPAGNVRIGDLNRMAPINSVAIDPQELLNQPIRKGAGPAVFLGDIGTVEDSSDILTGYALINGHRTVYIPVTKRADASTVEVVNRVKAELPRFQALVPEDIGVQFDFDQSKYVLNAISGLALEAGLGAVFTGLMVLLFLRDVRTALIVVITIPFALFAATVGLWLTGETMNIMTLGGLALAVGILVDEATVSVENIHHHLEQGQPLPIAVWQASRETLVPRFLSMLSVLAVFAPSFFMVGSTRSLFAPLSLAVGFAMLASYFLSSTLVPVLCSWFIRAPAPGIPQETPFLKVAQRYDSFLERLLSARWIVVAGYAVIAGSILMLVFPLLGRELFPTVDTGQFQLRLRAATGTRVERTEEITLNVLDEIAQEAGASNVDITLAFVGTQPPTYPINTIFLWTSGPHEAVIRVALRKQSGIRLEDFRERLRKRLAAHLPHVAISFEAGDIVTQIMNFGSPTPVEIAVSGAKYQDDKQYAATVISEMQRIASLRDVQYGQPQEYPTIDINVDRRRAGQLGIDVSQVGRSVLEATSSSRFLVPNYWPDSKTGIGYQLQVELPQSTMNSIDAVRNVPAMTNGRLHPLVSDVAEVKYGSTPGEMDRYNMQRMITITANVQGEDLGHAAARVREAVTRAGLPPRGVSVNVRGQIPAMNEAFLALSMGLFTAVLFIFILLTANFQSIRLAALVICIVPAIVAGAGLSLLLTGNTLNIQSFIGTIMAIGVGVANSILLVSFSETNRLRGYTSDEAARLGAKGRLRPILMTSFAMVAGMIPLALGLGEGGEQTAPLGCAVIGGLLASTGAVLIVNPILYSLFQSRASVKKSSVHPEDLLSREVLKDQGVI
jgi:multidrug efflux pump subunit AcrB